MLEYDTSWLGKEFDRYSYSVTKEEIVEFAQSIGETNPLYTDEAYAKTTPYGGLIAPRRSALSSVAMPGCLISS